MEKCKAQKNLKDFYEYIQNLNGDVTFEVYMKANELFSKIDKNFLETRNVSLHFTWCLNCLKKNELEKAKRHALKASRSTKPFANDYPLSVGDDAYVQRYEHGFMDCKMKIKIVQRTQVNGIWKYVGNVYDENEIDFVKDYKVDINHTRDIVPA